MNIWLSKETGVIIDYRISNQRLFRLSELAIYLEKNNHRVSMFFSSFDHFKKKQREAVSNKDSSIKNYMVKTIGYQSHVSLQRAISHYLYASRLRRLIKNLELPDIVVVSVPNIDSAHVLANYCISNNIPYIVDVRDMWPDIINISVKGFKKILISPYYHYLNYKLKRILFGASSIVASSPKYLDWAKEKAPLKQYQLSEVIYFGAKVNYSYSIKSEDNRIRIIFAGTISRQFDFDKVLDAAEKLLEHQEIEFILLGDGDQYPYLVEKSKKLENVRLTGWLDGEELRNLLSEGFLGLLPYKENINFTSNVTNKFSEYLSYGIPQLIGVSGLMTQLVLEHNIGFHYHDGKELAELILHLIHDQELYNRMVENSKKLFEKEFKIDVVNDRFQNVIINTHKASLK